MFKHYSDSDAARLMEAVEEQGGRYLPETCASDEIEYAMPDGTMRRTYGSGCEEEALFSVAYDSGATVIVNEPRLEPDPDPDAPMGRKRQVREGEGASAVLLYDEVEHEGTLSDTLSTARVCANDDLMRLWPRFAEHMKDPDPITGMR